MRQDFKQLKKVVGVRLTESEKETAKIIADHLGTSVSEFLRHLLRNELENWEIAA
jgi:antitoxin component of RelBE/YafQ-DinJ toxin-antitoxin module